ncbi:MAG: hypothetical protein ACKOQ4_16900 [Mycobacterium sp.]
MLYLFNVAAIAVAAWAFWQRRLTLQSRFDAPITYGIAAFGLAVALDSPWGGVAAASYPFTGKYYLLMGLGHVVALCGAALAIKATFMRLLPDDALGPFMRTRITPVIAVAGFVMLCCLIASPITSSMPADHLYLVAPDRWLIVYWCAFLGALLVLQSTAVFGMSRMRADPRSVMIIPMLFSQLAGCGVIALLAFGLLGHHSVITLTIVWPFAYLTIIAGSTAAVLSWRHRWTKMVRG